MELITYKNIFTGKEGKCTPDQFQQLLTAPGFRGKFAKVDPEAKKTIQDTPPAVDYVPEEIAVQDDIAEPQLEKKNKQKLTTQK